MTAKVQIKNEKYMPYGGIYFVIREYLRLMAPVGAPRFFRGNPTKTRMTA